MRREPPRCAVCAVPADQVEMLTGIVVAGEPMLLCPEHAQRLGDRRPDSFEDLVEFFEQTGLDRRKGERRQRPRRQFPPRPEGRRLGGGRRADDPAL